MKNSEIKVSDKVRITMEFTNTGPEISIQFIVDKEDMLKIANPVSNAAAAAKIVACNVHAIKRAVEEIIKKEILAITTASAKKRTTNRGKQNGN